SRAFPFLAPRPECIQAYTICQVDRSSAILEQSAAQQGTRKAMCGRYTLRTRLNRLLQIYAAESEAELEPRYNIAPTQDVAAVRSISDSNARELVLLHWGLIPAWADDPKIGNRMINARAETVAEKPSFRNALK